MQYKVVVIGCGRMDEVRSSFRAAMAADRALRTGSVVTL